MNASVKRAATCLIFTLTLGLNACSQKEDFALKEYAPKSANASIKEVSLGTSDTNQFNPQRVATQFPAGTKKVLVWYRWEGGDKDKKVDIHWSLGGTALLKQGEALGEKSGAAAWILQLGAGGDLPSGNYKVELLENGSLVTAIPFQVGSVASAAPTPVAQAPLPTPPDTPTPMAQPPASLAQAAAPKPSDAPVPMAQPAAVTATPPTPAVLASADGEMPGLRVEVIELKRGSGDTVTLKFTLINNSDKNIGSNNYLSDSEGTTVAAVHLIDPAGKKKYLVVRDAGKKCVCSNGMANFESKSRTNLWAKFPAPPAEVQKLSIVIPHFSPMDDVPISK